MLYRLSEGSDIIQAMKAIGCDPGGIKIMAKKARRHLFFIKQMRTPAANILKQDALAIGAELAVPGGVIVCETERVDGILICSQTQLEILAKKELAQPFGLKAIAKELQRYVKLPAHPTQLMGVLNINDDSFFSSSRVKSADFLQRAETMIAEGADILDIGGVSSRPGSEPVSEAEELERVRGAIDAIYGAKLYEKARFSIDSYAPKVIDYALSKGFKIVNDITGLSDDAVCKAAAGYNAQVCIMHMQGSPRDMQVNPEYDDVVCAVDSFFEERIEKAKSFGISDLILDTGIGFGKTLEHNLALIKQQSNFLKYGYPLLAGASRKSMIDKISPSPVEARLPGTLAIHLKALDEGASIIRAHDVPEHAQAMAVHKALSLA